MNKKIKSLAAIISLSLFSVSAFAVDGDITSWWGNMQSTISTIVSIILGLSCVTGVGLMCLGFYGLNDSKAAGAHDHKQPIRKIVVGGILAASAVFIVLITGSVSGDSQSVTDVKSVISDARS